MFKEEELNIKILKSLNRTWQLKVMTISESKDFASTTHAEIFGKLKEYEMDMTRIIKEEAKEKKHRDLALQSSILSSDESDEECVKGS